MGTQTTARPQPGVADDPTSLIRVENKPYGASVGLMHANHVATGELLAYASTGRVPGWQRPGYVIRDPRGLLPYRGPVSTRAAARPELIAMALDVLRSEHGGKAA